MKIYVSILALAVIVATAMQTRGAGQRLWTWLTDTMDFNTSYFNTSYYCVDIELYRDPASAPCIPLVVGTFLDDLIHSLHLD